MWKTRTWILLIAIVFVAAAVLSAVVFGARTDGRIAEIVQNGTVIRRIDLDAVTEPFTFTVTSEDGGFNVVSVERGRIRVSEADCPDKVCMGRGWCADSALPILCMPHRLLIRIVGESGVDAVSE